MGQSVGGRGAVRWQPSDQRVVDFGRPAQSALRLQVVECDSPDIFCHKETVAAASAQDEVTEALEQSFQERGAMRLHAFCSVIAATAAAALFASGLLADVQAQPLNRQQLQQRAQSQQGQMPGMDRTQMQGMDHSEAVEQFYCVQPAADSSAQ
jgi:hypothetical protein